MHLAGTHAKDLSRLGGDASKQLRGIMRVEPVQCPTQTIIVEVCGLYTWTEQMLYWFVGKELWPPAYRRRLLNPSPFKIIATVAVPILT